MIDMAINNRANTIGFKSNELLCNKTVAPMETPDEAMKKAVDRFIRDEHVTEEAKRVFGQKSGDTFQKSNLSTEDKQAMIKKARAKAAGMSILFGPWSALYYSLRSDEKVAKKFGLDAEADKDLITNIKHQQTKASLPALFCGGIGAIVSYICNKAKNPKNIEI